MTAEHVDPKTTEAPDDPNTCVEPSGGTERLEEKQKGDQAKSQKAAAQRRKKKQPIQRDENGKKIFTADSGLGFMRVIQIYNILALASTLTSLLFVTHSMLKDWGSVVIGSLVLDIFATTLIVWLLGKRKARARYVIPILYFFEAILSIIADVALETFSVESVVFYITFPVLMTIYFMTSRRAKAVLVRPINGKLISRDTAAERKMWNPRSGAFWMRILIYFFAFSVAGHWMEMGVQILVVNGLFPGTVAGADSLTWRDHWNPFFIYGIAVAFCGLVLFPLYVKFKEVMPKVWMGFILSFLINLVFVVVAEVVLGTLFNADYQAWDYRNQFLNWNGQVCLLYSLAFAVMASIITWVVYPLLEYLFSFVGHDAMRVIFVISLVFFIFLFCTYNVDLTSLYQQIGINPETLQTTS